MGDGGSYLPKLFVAGAEDDGSDGTVEYEHVHSYPRIHAESN